MTYRVRIHTTVFTSMTITSYILILRRDRIKILSNFWSIFIELLWKISGRVRLDHRWHFIRCRKSSFLKNSWNGRRLRLKKIVCRILYVSQSSEDLNDLINLVKSIENIQNIIDDYDNNIVVIDKSYRFTFRIIK